MDEDGYFGERVAARYDESVAELFEPGVVDPVVDFLVGLAGSGRALARGIGTGRIALAAGETGCARPRDRALEGDGGEAAREGGRRADRRDDRRLRYDDGPGLVLRRLPRLQHDREPHLAVGPG